MKPSPPPASSPDFSTLAGIVTPWRELNAVVRGADKVTCLRLGALLLPEAASIRAELQAVYPHLRTTRERLRALGLAVELLPPEAKPKQLGELMLELMAGR